MIWLHSEAALFLWNFSTVFSGDWQCFQLTNFVYGQIFAQNAKIS
jgi:hypothetical protein